MINYIPKLDSILWMLKSRETFESIDSLRHALAFRYTAISHYIGKDSDYHPQDVLLLDPRPRDPFTGWKNFCAVILDGITVGYCGE